MEFYCNGFPVSLNTGTIETTQKTEEVMEPKFQTWTSFSNFYTVKDNKQYINNINDDGYNNNSVRYAFFESHIYGGKITISMDTTKISSATITFIFVDKTGLINKTVQSETYMSDIKGEFAWLADAMYDKENYRYNHKALPVTGNLDVKVPDEHRAIVYIDLLKCDGENINKTSNTTIRQSVANEICNNKAISIKAFADTFDYAVEDGASLAGKMKKPPDPFLSFGLNSQIADWLWEAKEQWMSTWNGDTKKIPVIITTDQHGTWEHGTPVFEYLSYIVPWENVSKCLNLGDCVYNYTKYKEDGSEAQEDEMRKALSPIPKDKQVNILGNHDVTTLIEPGWLAAKDRFKPNLYFGAEGAKYFDEALGDFVLYDERFNVKYVCLNGWEYVDTRKYRNSSAQMDAIIKELEKNDGYDIVFITHAPLALEKNKSNVAMPTDQTYPYDAYNWAVWEKDAHLGIELWNGLLNKTAGSVLDSDGNEHSFDFTKLDGNVLCGLDGHTHANAWYHVGQTGLLNALFKCMFVDAGSDGCIDGLYNYTSKGSGKEYVMNSNTVSFALIDRVNNDLEVWNVSGASKGNGEIYGLNHWVAPFKFTPATTLTLSTESVTASVGDVIDVTATTDSTTECIVWRSSDETIARVRANYLDGENGTMAKVYCVGTGNATINVINESGTVTASCNIIVS